MAPEAGVENNARSWTKVLAQYRRPNTARSTIEIVVTVVPFALLWVVSALAVTYGYWWGLLLTIPAAGFLVRLFALQHDCGHGALFSRRGANDWTGRARYWLYRHPLVMFGIGPAWVFLCQYRLPLGMMRAGAQPWISTIATNLGIAVPAIALIWLLGIWPFLMIQLPITLLAATAGVWLFFVQHQFEETHWSQAEDWNFQHAALHGSSHYELPAVLRWFTGNIGIHHVHHLSSTVPFYRLPQVLRDYPELRDVGRIGILDSLRCVKLVLWDESARRLVSFREMRATARAG